MGRHEDPEGIELQTTLRHVSFENEEVLEVGCGSGRLTFKYAGMAKRVLAIDPKAEEIEKARENTPHELLSKLEFRVGNGDSLPLPDESYDTVFFTWSLCCIPTPYDKLTALEEAWRVLKPEGILINLQSSLLQPLDRGVITYLMTKRFGSLADVADDEDGEARRALKYITLIEGKFRLLAEEEFMVNAYYDSVAEALDDFIKDKREQYNNLDEQTKHKIFSIISSKSKSNGVVTRENAVLTVLSRAIPAKTDGRSRVRSFDVAS